MITRDYSMNNAISGASYNSWGQPVIITGGDLDFFFFNLADNSRIEYECPEWSYDIVLAGRIVVDICFKVFQKKPIAISAS